MPGTRPTHIWHTVESVEVWVQRAERPEEWDPRRLWRIMQGLDNAGQGFTLHNVRLGSDALPALVHGELNPPGYVIEPHVRVEAVARRSPVGHGVELHRVPLVLSADKEPARSQSA
jgi:hypothetical protein